MTFVQEKPLAATPKPLCPSCRHCQVMTRLFYCRQQQKVVSPHYRCKDYKEIRRLL